VYWIAFSLEAGQEGAIELRIGKGS